MSFEHILGQKRAVSFLTKMVEGARARGEPFPHSKLLGPPGTGKTTLVRCLAEEFGTKAHVVIGGPQVTIESFAEAVQQVSEFDFIFLDEAHAVRRQIQEILYRVIDSGEIPVLDAEEGKKRKVIRHRAVGSITIILATNQPGGILDALASRVSLDVTLDRYSVDDLILIGRQHATKLKILLTTQAMRLIATFGDGIPRQVKQRLQYLATYLTTADGCSEITVEDVRTYLEAEGTDV